MSRVKVNFQRDTLSRLTLSESMKAVATVHVLGISFQSTEKQSAFSPAILYLLAIDPNFLPVKSLLGTLLPSCNLHTAHASLSHNATKAVQKQTRQAILAPHEWLSAKIHPTMILSHEGGLDSIRHKGNKGKSQEKRRPVLSCDMQKGRPEYLSCLTWIATEVESYSDTTAFCL